MKKILLLTAFFFASANAQITKPLQDFSKVTAFDQISVYLIPADENKIELTGVNAELIELVYNKQELKIRLPLQKMLKGEDILAKVYYKNLEAIEGNEGTTINMSAPIKATYFSVIAKEGSHIKLTVEASKIEARVSQGSTIDLKGKTNNLDILANSGGSIEATNCEAVQATVAVNAGGEVMVNATDLVDAKIRAGGTITIYGNPKQVNQKTILGGDIILKTDKKYSTR